MKLQFLGATGTVTGSKYLLEAGGHRILVDCGLFQGFKQLRLRNWAPLPVDPKSLSAVILTHAHIDHSGYLPLLVRDGFRGRVHCTRGTRDLCRVLLPDAGRLQEEEAQQANKHGWSRHKPALPLYTEKDALRALEQFDVADFGDRIEPVSGLSASLLPAGHILGAAIARIECEGRSIAFSGDLGRQNDLVMWPPAKVANTDYLVVESTYGDRSHEPTDAIEQLGEVIRRTARRGGVVLIPSFAVGRAQALLHGVHLLRTSGRIPAGLPIFLNSPMATDVTALYKRHRAEHRLSDDECEGMCRAARIVNTIDESRALNSQQGPMVIIAGSGMATGGRIVHHLKAFASDERNTIVLTGFQAGGTRGAAIEAGAEMLKIHGQYIPLRAEVASLRNLSAHADAAELIDWLRGFARPPRRTFITHGEPASADALRLKIEETLRWDCTVPEYRETVLLD